MLIMATTARTPSQARTGRDFALTRELLGITLRSVAVRLAIDPMTLRRWEANAAIVEATRADRWHAALAALADHRAVELARSGFAVRDIEDTDLGQLLAAFQTTLATA